MQSWSDVAVPTLEGSGPPLRLYDTADRTVRPVAPGPTATMYVCGITPYDATHMGHAATYVAFDLVGRVLADQGHGVHYVQNVTDVDDPLFERAARDGVDWRALGEEQTELFRTDMAALRVVPPRDYVGAIESVDEVIAMVRSLLDSDAAYIVDDPQYPDVYFSVHATEQFGYESGYDAATMARLFAERGGDPDRPGKRDRLDALLWRAERDGEPAWESPFGRGRPGWHIECSAIALNRLGTGFDIQGGGSDLIFPHHEFSSAHGEAATGTRRFARHYVHCGMMGLDGEKMSKSRGNLVLVSALRAAGEDPMAIRLALLDGHYRADRFWTADLLKAARARLARWRSAVSTAADAGPDPHEVIARVRRHLADDLDSGSALDAIDGWACDVETGIGSVPDAGTAVARAADALLGLALH